MKFSMMKPNEEITIAKGLPKNRPQKSRINLPVSRVGTEVISRNRLKMKKTKILLQPTMSTLKRTGLI